jgi:hypothetical protein
MDKILIISREKIKETALMMKSDGWIMQIDVSPGVITGNQIEYTSTIVYSKDGELKTDKDYRAAFVKKYLEYYGEK